MKIGILFGGKSREREISFAGGRTVYDLLDKTLFTPVPIFVDSLGHFIELDWQYLYKGSIRDFYPGAHSLTKDWQIYIESLEHLSEDQLNYIINKVGKRIRPEELNTKIDFAFLTLHGPYGEDGSIQGLLSFYNIPYSGSGILPSAIGIDKKIQKNLMQQMGILAAKAFSISRKEWMDKNNHALLFEKANEQFDLPVVIKSSSQGSSIGVSILKEWDYDEFRRKINQSLFIKYLHKREWEPLNETERKFFIHTLSDIYEGIGIPIKAGERIIYHPEDLYHLVESHFKDSDIPIMLESMQTEGNVLIEEFIDGKEFSCIVIEGENGEPIALPPTEILKKDVIFDYRAKYLPGIARKITPIQLPEETIEHICTACEKLYIDFQFDVYARIDGIIKKDGSIYLNDPNTTSGMLPSSFFFHQAAEIGLSPSQFLTYIVRRSLQKRIEISPAALYTQSIADEFDKTFANKALSGIKKQKIAVILGGVSTERHISVESGRNVFEKLSSSGKYEVMPVFLTSPKSDTDKVFQLYTLPLNLLLKDNADDIKNKAKDFKIPPIINRIIKKAEAVTKKYASADYEFYPREITLDELKEKVDFAFIALHGRPGEDGSLQELLETKKIPYNGSGPESSSITINKFITNELLRVHGFLIPEHTLIKKEDWKTHNPLTSDIVSDKIIYPFIAKPADDGCSSAVKKINNAEQFTAFSETMFREKGSLTKEQLNILSLKADEEFPMKDFFVVEELVGANGADRFMEITGGMFTYMDENGQVQYEVFEASEALAEKGILSLEEKFLAGEGQNITPARYSSNAEENSSISSQVKEIFRRAAIVLHIEGYCRIDAFVRIYNKNHIEVVFIEVNSLPGLTPATCIFHQAALDGYKPVEFLEKIIGYGLHKKTSFVKVS